MPQAPRAQSENRASLAEIANRTKISHVFLEAIEREDFGKLPGGIFDRSYIRQYAQAAGLDENEILRRYHEFQAEQEARAAERMAPQQPRPRRASPLRSLVEWVTSV